MKTSVMKGVAMIWLVICMMLSSCGGQSTESAWQEQYDLGIRYLSDGNYEEAIIAFTAAIEIDPNRAEAYVGRGDAYIGSGEAEDNLTAALADYEKAVDLDVTNVNAWLGLADIYIKQGNYKKAQEIIEQGKVFFAQNSSELSALEEIEQRLILEMLGNEDYGFLFSGDMVVPQEWTVNGKPITDTTLSDWQSAYPSEDAGVSGSGDNVTYTPYWRIDDHTLRPSNISAYFEGESLFWVHWRGEDGNNDYATYIQPELREIKTSDTFNAVMQKIGFTEIGTQYLTSAQEPLTIYYENKFRLSYTVDEAGYRNVNFTVYENEQRTEWKVLSFLFNGDHLTEIYYQDQPD